MIRTPFAGRKSFVGCVVAALFVLAAVFAGPASAATTLNVNTTADVSATTGACGNTSIVTPPSTLSLREATCLANNIGGTVTINVPAGTYVLTTAAELQPGLQSGQTVNYVGAGSGQTIIDGNGNAAGTTGHRIFEYDLNLVGGVGGSVSGMTLQNAASPNQYGGAAIVSGQGHAATVDTLNVNDVRFIHDISNASKQSATNEPGGAVYIAGGVVSMSNSFFQNDTAYSSMGSAMFYGGGGATDAQGQHITISNTTFDNNDSTLSGPSGLVGGALALTDYANATVSNVVFKNNDFTSTTAQPAAGGAIHIEDGDGTTFGNVVVTGSTFTNNTVSGTGAGVVQGGGAVFVGAESRATFHDNRFAGNTAPSGSGGGAIFNMGTTDAADNWWGCNGGPNATGCDTTVSTQGSLTTTPFLVFGGTASPSTITGPNASSTITAGFTHDSNGSALSAGNIANLAGLSGTAVSWSETNPPSTGAGTVGSASTNLGSAGTASVTYSSHNAAGIDHVQAGLDSASVTVPVTVNQAPVVTSDPLDEQVNAGDPVSFTAAASGYPAPTVQWQRDSGSGFANISGATSTTYSFTAAAGDDGSKYRAVFTNSVSSATSAAATLTVGSPPAFTSANHTTFVAGSAGSFTITTSGTPSPTITATSILPTWLTLTDNGDGTATLSGTPPAGSGGSYSISLQADNGHAPAATQTFTLNVNEAPTIVSANNTTFSAGSPGTFEVTTTGTPDATITATNTLPSWLSLTADGPGTAALAGTPPAGSGGTYVVDLKADNGVGTAATQTFTLTVNEAPAFTSANHTTFVTTNAGSFDVTTSGFPNAAITATNSLPGWLTLTDNGDGTATLSGTAPAGSGGSVEVDLRADNGIAPAATQTFTLNVNEAPSITSANHATFTVGSAGSFDVTSTGTPTATISATSSLPSWLSLSDNGDGTATLSGTPPSGAGGTYQIDLQADNGTAPTATQTFTLTVDEAPAFTSANNTTFVAGSPGSFSVTTSGTPNATITATSTLPSWLHLSASSGGAATLSGTPPTGSGGTYNIGLKADNGVGSAATQAFTLQVNEAPTITSANHGTFVIGQAGSFSITSTGTPSATITTSTTLPSWLHLSSSSGGVATLTGTPPTGSAGSYPIALKADNGVGTAATQTFTLTVNPAIVFTSADHTTWTVGQASTFRITTASSPAATITVTNTLPSWLHFTMVSPGVAKLTGTPPPHSGGTYQVNLRATDGVDPPATQAFTLTVNEAPGINSPKSATFTIGVAKTFTVTTTGFPAPTLTETGTLPNGLSFTAGPNGTATISGTAAAGTLGTYNITLKATNAAGTTTQGFTIRVVKPGS